MINNLFTSSDNEINFTMKKVMLISGSSIKCKQGNSCLFLWDQSGQILIPSDYQIILAPL